MCCTPTTGCSRCSSGGGWLASCARRRLSYRTRHHSVSALGSGLRRLVGILDGSAFVLAPGTGPLYMSAALGRSVISLIGYTNPRRTRPYRYFHDMLINAYGDPGEEYGFTMEKRPGRMSRIRVSDVLEKVGVRGGET
jgi:heptosyltransferase I